MILPRSGWVQPVDIVSGGGGGGGTITAVTQVPVSVKTTPLAAGGSSVSASQDMTNFESFGVSTHVKSIAGQPLTTHVLVENSLDGATWDTVESVTLNNSDLNSVYNFNRVYSVTRKFYRATLVNDDGGNALSETRFALMLKPI